MIAIARLYVLPLTSIPPEAVAEGLDYVSAEKRARLHRFRQRADLMRGLWADLLLRSRIVEDLGLSHARIPFEQNAFGKPRLSGVDHYHFNVSHAGEWVVCLVDSEPVGVDVEHVQAFDEGVARDFYTEEEYRYVMEGAQSQERELRFYQIWTAKESYIKAVGQGLSLPLQDFSVMSAEGVQGIKQLRGEAWQLTSWNLDAHIAAQMSRSASSNEAVLGQDTPHEGQYLLTACCQPTDKSIEPEQLGWNAVLTIIRSAYR